MNQMTPSLAPGDHTLDLAEFPLRIRVAGHGPVLLLHPPGWGIGATPYVRTLQPLEEHYTVVYLWPRGGADAAPAPTADLDVSDFVADLEAAREALGLDEFALAGHSHGGLIALHYALRYPDRLTHLLLLSAQIQGVTGTADPPDRPVPPDPPEVRAALEQLAAIGGLSAMFDLPTDQEATAFLVGLLPLYLHDQEHLPLLAEAMQGTVLPRKTLQSVTAADVAFDLDPSAVQRLPVATVVVAGRQDRFCPPWDARRLAELLPHAALVELADSGHFPWLEEPEEFYSRVLEALRTLTDETRQWPPG
jgi:pimeloyl-ACP methyl ester carboxylesterase